MLLGSILLVYNLLAILGTRSDRWPAIRIRQEVEVTSTASLSQAPEVRRGLLVERVYVTPDWQLVWGA